MKTFVLAAASIACSVTAQFLLKAGMVSVNPRGLAQPLTIRAALDVFTNAFILSGLVLYGLGAVVWLAVLARWDVSKAYPLVGLGFAATVMIGMMTGEAISSVRVVGIALISAGVWLVATS